MVQPTSTSASPKNDNPSVHWHALSADSVLERLHTPVQTGLSQAEATSRLEKYGPNQLSEAPRRTFFMMVVAQLNNFVVMLLIAAAIISAVVSLGRERTLY
jgi:P-type Ca2+ transporter type 2C